MGGFCFQVPSGPSRLSLSTWALPLTDLITGKVQGWPEDHRRGPRPGLTGHHLSFRMHLISLHSLFFAAYAYSRSLIHSGFWFVVGTAVLAGSSLKSTASIFTNRCLNVEEPSPGNGVVGG